MSRILRLLDTIRGRNQRRGDRDNDTEPPLPLLPAERRPITPPATLNSTTTDSLVPALGTFARLPPELRRRVLVLAFGDRTFHLDLRLVPRGQRPRSSRGYSPPWTDYEHGCGWAPMSMARVVMNGDVPVAEKDMVWEWRWHGSVCHRLLPRGSPIDHHIRAQGRSPYQWPCRDDCLRGEAMMCEFWPTEPPAPAVLHSLKAACDAEVGVLGWLCACRQAYIEGIEVLYTTNTFFTGRDFLSALLNHPDRDPAIPNVRRQLLLSQRLADIRSLELGLDILLFGDVQFMPPLSRSDEKNRMRQLPHLAELTTVFPNLGSLVISFSDHLYNDESIRPKDRLPEIQRLLLQPLAHAVASFVPQRKQHVVVELPSNVFCDLKGLGLEEEQREEEWKDGRGLWLRYSIEDSFFYYIKQGVESDLSWFGPGDKPRRGSHMRHMYTNCGM